MNRADLRNLAGRYSTIAVLAAFASATVWYITGEDARVGNDYGRIFKQDPSLIPANLTSLAALHIQTAGMVAQMCVTIGLALAFSRIPRRSSKQPDEVILALRALTEALNRLGSVPAAIPSDPATPAAGGPMAAHRQATQGRPFMHERGTTSTASSSPTPPESTTRCDIVGTNR